MSESHGTVIWSELATRDVPAAKKFYEKVCGWTYDEVSMGGEGVYHVARLGEKMIAGIMDMGEIPEMDEVMPHWLTYLAVDDADKAARDTTAGGGKVLREPWDVPGVGQIAIVMDASGAVIGLLKPSS